MANMWQQNEQKSEEDELTVTSHREEPDEVTMPEDVETVETPEDSTRDALRELGEDVESSPARRGHVNKTKDPDDHEEE